VQVPGVIVPAELVLQVAADLEEKRGPDRLCGGVDLAQRGLGQHDPPDRGQLPVTDPFAARAGEPDHLLRLVG
jgi:hypothetical protein